MLKLLKFLIAQSSNFVFLCLTITPKLKDINHHVTNHISESIIQLTLLYWKLF